MDDYIRYGNFKLILNNELKLAVVTVIIFGLLLATGAQKAPSPAPKQAPVPPRPAPPSLVLPRPAPPSPAPPSPAPPSPAPPSPAPPIVINLTGKVMYKNTHIREIWTLEVMETNLYTLPGQPVQADSQQAIPPGATVTLTCTLIIIEEEMICVNVTNARISLVAAPVRTVGLSIKLLVLVVRLTGSCIMTGADIQAVQTAYMGALGYANFLRNCSYGKVVYESVTVLGTPVECSTSIKGCNPDAISKAARARAVQLNGNGYLSGFTHFTYVLPTGLIDTCGWVGLAELPGTQTWYTPDEYGIYNKGTVLQESVHNLGIYHGWRGGKEYQDYSTSMGSGDSCPSAPELWRLGWATVMAQLNMSTFPSRRFNSYDLPATYLGPNNAMIKIQPDWLSSFYTKNVYLALRVKAGGDMNLMDEFNGKVNIHELNKAIDNSIFASGDPRVTIINTVAPFISVTLTAYRLVIRTESLLQSDTKIRVKVCRYDASITECQDTPQQSPPPITAMSPPPVVVRQPPPSRRPPSPSPKQSPPPPLLPRPPPPRPFPPPPAGKKKSPPPPPSPQPPLPPPPSRKKPPPARKNKPPPPNAPLPPTEAPPSGGESPDYAPPPE